VHLTVTNASATIACVSDQAQEDHMAGNMKAVPMVVRYQYQQLQDVHLASSDGARTDIHSSLLSVTTYVTPSA
jgi:hypothetical protein